MTAIYNLPSTDTVSAGDQIPFFPLAQGTTYKVSIDTLAKFIAANYPTVAIQAIISSLIKQTDPGIAPVPTGQAYLSIDGFVVVAQ